MVRSYWIGPVVVALAVTGLALSQTSPPPVETKERLLTVQETDKPAFKCRVLKAWRQPEGHKAYLVQALANGEYLTVAESGETPAGSKTLATKIYHWGDSQTPPPGTPEVPNNALVLGTPYIRPAEAAPTPTAVVRSELPRIPVVPVTSASGKKWPSAFASGGADAEPGVRTLAKQDDLKTTMPTLKPVPTAVATSKQPDPKSVGTTPTPLPSVEIKKPATVVKEPEVKKPVTVVKAPEVKSPESPPKADWRSSWGKADTAVALSATLPTPTPSKTPALNVVQSEPLPSKDPLANPARYTKLPTDLKPAPKESALATTPAISSDKKDVLATTKAPEKPAAPMVVAFERDKPTPPATPGVQIGVGKVDGKTTPPPVSIDLTKPDAKTAVASTVQIGVGKVEDKQTPKPTLPVAPNTAPTTTAKVAITPVPPPLPATTPKTVTPTAPAPLAVTNPVLPPLPTTVTKTPTEPNPVLPPMPATTPKTLAPLPAVDPVAAERPGMKSVVSAKQTPVPSPVVQVQETGNAFSTPVATPPAGVAPVQPPTSTVANGNMQPVYPTARPPILYQQPGAMDRGVPTAMANAFTVPSSARPIPANFGPQAQVPNAFGDGNTATVTYAAKPPANPNSLPVLPRSPMDRPIQTVAATTPAPAVKTPSAGSPARLLAILSESLYPSQRAAAAEALGKREGHAEPEVVGSLLKTAKEDAAPMVRAECVRSLGRLKADTPATFTALKALKDDADAQVRQEAEQALIALTGGKSTTDAAVQPASLSLPK